MEGGLPKYPKNTSKITEYAIVCLESHLGQSHQQRFSQSQGCPKWSLKTVFTGINIFHVNYTRKTFCDYGETLMHLFVKSRFRSFSFHCFDTVFNAFIYLQKYPELV